MFEKVRMCNFNVITCGQMNQTGAYVAYHYVVDNLLY